MVMQNSSGDRLSPWKILLLTLASGRCISPSLCFKVIAIVPFCIWVLSNSLMAGSILYMSRHLIDDP